MKKNNKDLTFKKKFLGWFYGVPIKYLDKDNDLLYFYSYIINDPFKSLEKKRYSKHNGKIKEIFEKEIKENNFAHKDIIYEFKGPEKHITNSYELILNNQGNEYTIGFLELINNPIMYRLYLDIPNEQIKSKIFCYYCWENDIKDHKKNSEKELENYLTIKKRGSKWNKYKKIDGVYTKSSALIKSITQLSKIITEYDSFLKNNEEFIIKNSKKLTKIYDENNKSLEIAETQKQEGISAFEQEVLSKLQ